MTNLESLTAYEQLMESKNQALYRKDKCKATGNQQRLQDQYLELKRKGLALPSYLPTAELLLRSPGVEVACRPVLYPWAAYGDSDMKERLVGSYLDERANPLARRHYLMKSQSMCLGYAGNPALAFLIHDISMATSIMGKLHVADQRNLGAPCLVDNSQRQARFWLHEQDLLCDLVWQMRMSCMDVEGCPELHDICLVNKTVLWHPNVFITTAAGECLLPSMFADLKLFRHF